MMKFRQQIWNLGRTRAPKRSLAVEFLGDFAFAAALVGCVFVVRWLLGFVGSRILIFAVCYPAVLVATLIAGARCGLIALALSMLVFGLAFGSPGEASDGLSLIRVVNIALYGFSSAVIIWIAHVYRQTLEGLRLEQARNGILVRELSHRSRNGLAVISTIVRQSLRHDPEGTNRIIGRIAALKQGEELLLASEIEPIEVRDLLARELRVYDTDQLSLDGPAMTVGGDLAKTLCMVVHELATNAIKYGAWSSPGGKVRVSWGPGSSLSFLEWAEDGGDSLARPVSGGDTHSRKAGFGTFLVEQLIAQHGGEARMSLGPSGVVWRLTFARPDHIPAGCTRVCPAARA
ncbi:MAG: HWE histidine kinase domain-containing protein [Hyphomicrobiaceae bacterium]|nr:HWE histidine kinase domain-containing protein [Hyphomicrobiaceae bacterium]